MFPRILVARASLLCVLLGSMYYFARGANPNRPDPIFFSGALMRAVAHEACATAGHTYRRLPSEPDVSAAAKTHDVRAAPWPAEARCSNSAPVACEECLVLALYAKNTWPELILALSANGERWSCCQTSSQSQSTCFRSDRPQRIEEGATKDTTGCSAGFAERAFPGRGRRTVQYQRSQWKRNRSKSTRSSAFRLSRAARRSPPAVVAPVLAASRFAARTSGCTAAAGRKRTTSRGCQASRGRARRILSNPALLPAGFRQTPFRFGRERAKRNDPQDGIARRPSVASSKCVSNNAMQNVSCAIQRRCAASAIPSKRSAGYTRASSPVCTLRWRMRSES